MSAPNTDVENEERKHKPALLGIKGAMIFAGALLLGLVTWLSYQGNEPGEPAAHVDGRTGELDAVE